MFFKPFGIEVHNFDSLHLNLDFRIWLLFTGFIYPKIY